MSKPTAVRILESTEKMHVRWSDLDKQTPALKPSESDAQKQDASVTPTNTDLYHALFPLFHLSKLCGLLPVTFQRDASRRYQGRVSTVGVIYSLGLLIFLIGAEAWGFWRDLRDGWENSTRLKSQTAVLVTCIDVLGVITLTTVAILRSPFRWKHLQTVMDKLVETDDKLGIVAPKKTRRFAILITVGAIVYLLSAACLDVYLWELDSKITKKRIDKGAINYAPLYLMYVVIIVMENQYALSTYNVAQRFARLNASLENILKTGRITEHLKRDLGLAANLKDQVQIGTLIGHDLEGTRMFRKSKIMDWYAAANGTKNFAETLSELVTIHSSLCDTVTFINSAFGLGTLTVTITCLLHLIITPYFLIMQTDGNREVIFFVDQGLWVIWHVMRLLIIVQPTYAANTEAKRTAVVVSQLLSANPDAESRKHLEVFSLQLLHRPLQFSALGLFALDRALMTSIAGAVTTYLVILIQFQKADESKGDVDNIIKNATQLWKNASSLTNLTALKALNL